MLRLRRTIGEIQNLTDGEEIALWAHRRLPAENTLTTDDARAVETACQVVLSALNLGADEFEQFPILEMAVLLLQPSQRLPRTKTSEPW